MKKFLVSFFLGILVLGSAVGSTYAQNRNTLPLGDPIYDDQSTNYDPVIKRNIVKKYIDNSFEEGTENALSSIFQAKGDSKSIVFIGNIILGTIGLLWLMILAVKFIIARGDDENLAKYKAEVGWIILGLAAISAAEFLAFQIFDPTNNILGTGESASNFDAKMIQIIRFFEYFVGGVILIKVMMAGYGLIIESEDDQAIEKEKTFFKAFSFGVAYMLFAEVLVRYVFDAGGRSGAGATVDAAKRGITEVVGVINFVLTYLGWIAVFMLILSSIYYVTSLGNDDQMSRAKRIIFSSITGIIVILSSYTIMRFMIR